MVKTAAAAFAFLALFGTPIAAQFADAEEAKSWFFLQRIARDLEESHKTGDKPVVRAN